VSTLWHVRVEDRSQWTVTFSAHATHPDAGALSTSKTFAFRLLADTARGRLAEEDGPETYDDPRLMMRKAEQVIESSHVSDLRNFPFDEEAAKAGVEADLRARGLTPERHEAWDSAYDQAWYDLWHDVDRVPSATLTIRLADPSWATQVQPGREWDTAAYG
jgi:hypothetical protein